jgi:uncharacterized protein
MSPSGEPREIALFPLNTVLFPEGPLPLRIFETRYVDMVRRCMREGACFGVVLIRSGPEAGSQSAGAPTMDIGTAARIVDFSPLPDGLLGISCLGEQRFRILRRWRQADGLNLGEVEYLPQPPAVELPAEHANLGEVLRSVLPQLGEIYQDVPRRFTDASWVSWRLAEILPISLQDKQYCLELEDPLQRLERLAPLIRRPDEA